MVYEPEPYRRFPKVPIERRIGAFAIDFLTVCLISSIISSGIFRWLVFLAGWFALRVIFVDKNQGQSLGRWALDMKIIDARLNRAPGLIDLAKREAIVGFAALLAMIGLSINFANGLSMLILVCPLLVDCAIAFADEQYSQAFHDRLTNTIVIQTRRGFSLDLRLKRLASQLKKRFDRY
ncbi:MAG: hypothetical protein D6756_04805 [Cyanobacteria bacterium J083]|nr:MAG: hypothetical protein D6756_04805 [Cyanobacteria bacterium J083]